MVLICTVLTSVVAILLTGSLWTGYQDGGSPHGGVILALLALALLATAWWRPIRASWIAPVAAVSALIVMLAAMLFGTQVALRAQLDADRATIAALRSASAIYYGKNGVFPTKETLQTMVEANRTFGAALRCPGASWSADTTNGKITYTPNTLDAC